MKLILLGAPGAGKGTQADILAKLLGVPTISTGNILRAAVKNGTPVGLKAKEYMDAGALVPDEVIIGIIAERLAEPDCKNGYILDGVPRTIPQAEAMEKSGIDIDCALSIEVADEVIVKRMSGRRTCPNCGASFHVESNPPKKEGVCDVCGSTNLTRRADDNAETMKTRLKAYRDQTAPILPYYQGKGMLKSIDGMAPMDEVFVALEKGLGFKG